jgi:hypothetical protein
MPMSSIEPGYPCPMLCLPINHLGAIMLKHAKSCPVIEILWGHKAVKTGQDERAAWVEVEHDSIFTNPCRNSPHQLLANMTKQIPRRYSKQPGLLAQTELAVWSGEILA